MTPSKRPRSSKPMFSIPDPKGLVGKYLETQDLDITHMYSTYHEG
jgi:hypothetical protein